MAHGEERDANDTAIEDVREIAVALGIGGHARPYSAHEVVQKEILPTIEKLRRDLLNARGY
jgi:hypothetical protein